MSKEPQRTCPSCGNEFSGAMEFCPVCMLRKGLAGGVESGESSFEEAVRPTADPPRDLSVGVGNERGGPRQRSDGVELFLSMTKGRQKWTSVHGCYPFC